MYKHLLVLLLVTLGLTACSSQAPTQHDFSGFLGDYSRFQSVTFNDSSKGLRWVSPELRLGERQYNSVQLLPVTVFSQVQSTQGAEILDALTQEIENQLTAALTEKGLLAEQPGAGVLQVELALTGLNVSLEDFKVQEAIPLRLLISGAMAAAGERDRVVEVLIELRGRDALTGETVVQAIRKGEGRNLKNDKEQLSQEHVRELLTTWTNQWVDQVEQLVNREVILCENPRPEICTRIYDPTCGLKANGESQNYSNLCSACADPSVEAASRGACL